MDKMRILSMPLGEDGCSWYRVRQPFTMMRLYTDHEVHITDMKTDTSEQVYEALKVANPIILRQGAERGMRDLLAKYPEIKGKLVLDIDDNIELISPYSEHYSEYGTQEFYDKNADKWIWKDRQNIDILSNRLRVTSLIKGMSESAMVTCTTKKLKEYALQYNPNVVVLPNCVDLARWWKLNLRPNKRLQVGWSGGISHYEDWFDIKEPLNKLMREYDFDLVMAGSEFGGLFDEDNKKRLKIFDWVPFKGHSYRMMCLGLDIALIPLANLPFNNYKSSVKWYEMSAMGVPSVVSNIVPYSEDITDGENALGYNSPKTFYKALKSLLEDATLRKKIGYQARKWVEKNRDAKKNVGLWVDAYKSLV